MIPNLTAKQIEAQYARAKETFALFGVDTDAALETLDRISISLHCWQGDDVGGFEVHEGALDGGGIQATGNYPGKARTADELRQDLMKALSLIPGSHRVNLHAMYAETGGKKVERDKLQPEHFARWMDWAKKQGLKLDFNGTFFAHEKAESGLTLSSSDEDIRRFWVRHGIVSREIAAAMGQAQGEDCIANLWIPDGMKDLPADRWTPRRQLLKSLDEIFAQEMPGCKDAVECKLFGIGSESYVVGSHEFYMGYAMTRNTMLCLDMGHFHPTETIADKISAILMFSDELLLHVSRGVRWDSDHVVLFGDDLRALCQEIVRGNVLHRIHYALDFFDASINRIGAWVIGARAFQKALLAALLEPTAMLQEMERKGDGVGRLGLMEDSKTMPLSAVWDYFCLTQDVPTGASWLNDVRAYERDVLSKR